MGRVAVGTADLGRQRGGVGPVLTVTPPAASLASAIAGLTPSVYLKLNESSGTNIVDYSGNTRNGTLAGAGGVTLAGTAGPGGNYVAFAGGGNSGSITIPDASVFSLVNNGITGFICLRPTSVSAYYAIFNKNQASNFEWGWMCNDTFADRMWFLTNRMDGGTNPVTQRANSTTFVSNTWGCYAFSIDGPTSFATIKLYYNSGTPLSGTTTTAPGDTSADTTSPITIGQLPWAPGYQWYGAMAHMALFPRVLSDSEVGTIMTTAQGEGWF